MILPTKLHRLLSKLNANGGSGSSGGSSGGRAEGPGQGQASASTGGNVSGAATGQGRSGYDSATSDKTDATLGQKAVDNMAAVQAKHGLGALSGMQAQGLSASSMSGDVDTGTMSSGLSGAALDAAISLNDNATARAIASKMSRSEIADYNQSRFMSKMGLASKGTHPSIGIMSSALSQLGGLPGGVYGAAALAAGLDTVFGVPFGMKATKENEDRGPSPGTISQFSTKLASNAMARPEYQVGPDFGPTFDDYVSSQTYKPLMQDLKVRGSALSNLINRG